MSTYIELMPDAELERLMAPYRRVLVISCEDCTNTSVAYRNGVPLATRDFSRGITNWKFIGAKSELGRIASLLRSQGKSVVCEEEQPCLLTDEKETHYALRRTDIDVALCLTCVAGKVGVEKTVGGAYPVILGAATTGFLQLYLDVKGQEAIVNKQKSTLIELPQPISESPTLEEYWAATNS